jgi:hypothetical protein
MLSQQSNGWHMRRKQYQFLQTSWLETTSKHLEKRCAWSALGKLRSSLQRLFGLLIRVTVDEPRSCSLSLRVILVVQQKCGQALQKDHWMGADWQNLICGWMERITAVQRKEQTRSIMI